METIISTENYLREMRFRFPHLMETIMENVCDISFVKFIEATNARIVEDSIVAKKAMKRQLMLQRNPHLANKDGMTPLHIAARNGQTSICKYMMKNEEIIPNIIDYLGQTALHYAAEKGHFEIAQVLIYRIKNSKEPIKKQTLHYFELEVAMSLIEEQPYEVLNPKNIYGVTPLHNSVLFSHVRICKLIIQNAKEKNPITDYGRNLLETSLRTNSTKIRQFVKSYLDSFSVKI